jgi:hypothetical protein
LEARKTKSTEKKVLVGDTHVQQVRCKGGVVLHAHEQLTHREENTKTQK